MSSTCPQLITASNVSSLLASTDNLVFDLDGTLWDCNGAFPGAVDTLLVLHGLGKRIYYCTNNSSKSRAYYSNKVRAMGFPCTEENIVCTAFVVAEYLQQQRFHGKIYVVGEAGLQDELTAAGFEFIGPGPDPITGTQADWVQSQLDPEVNCVVVGLDTHFSYAKLIKATNYARREGTLFIATNQDTELPTGTGIFLPGTGTLVGAVSIGARRTPIVVGKPNPAMFEVIQRKYGLRPERTLMVGDRLDTDIAFGPVTGMKSLLVLTGISSLRDVPCKVTVGGKELIVVPDFYLHSIKDLGDAIVASQAEH